MSARSRGTPSPMITLRDVTVRYPGFRLGPLSLSLAAGERIALIGPNGAGKSTLLNAIGARDPGYDGRILWRGEDLRPLVPEIRARIGFLPETLRGYGWMTVEERLRFLAAFFPDWDRRHEAELVRRLDLPVERRVAELSKGTKVKLSFVAAEAHRPPALLLDEPTAGIDPVMRGELLELLGECAPRNGRRLLVFSSHLLEDVAELCDRVVLLREGRLVADVSVDELRGRGPGVPLRRAVRELLTDA